MESQKLSQQKIAHALRHFVLCGALWSIYGPNATVAGSLFTGFASEIGLQEAQIAFLVSLSSLAGVSQMLSFYVTRRIRNRRLFMVTMGHLEITAASCVVLLALARPELRFIGVSVLLVSAYLIGHTVSPMFSSWLSNVLPEAVRATYTGRRMFILTVTSMVYLYAASQWVDRVPGLRGFSLVFLVGWIAGLAGYWLLLVTPMPRMEVDEGGGFLRSFAEPWRTPGFTRLAIFASSWTVGMSIAGAFYAIYMLKYLDMTYSRIAIYTNITLFCMVAGYLSFGPLAQRYGSKPLAQLLIVPGMAVPILWVFTTAENCAWVVPIACVLNGLSISGLSVAISSLLYKIVPQGQDNSPYWANWTGMSALASAAGPFVGGFLRNHLPATTEFAGMELTSIQVIFGLAGCVFVLPIIVSALLAESDATTPLYLLGQFRGNLLSFAYNFALYTVSKEDSRRARAIRDLGRSGTPLAVTPLVKALGHMSPEVRAEAARGLGEGHFREAVDPLLEALEDEESDIRSQAAEALGKIGDASASGNLLRALQDPDPRVRTSAAMALGEISDPEASRSLLSALQGPFDRDLFPTLVEAATHREELELVEPILAGLPRLHHPVVRMQVLNGVGRVLGEKNHFYRLASADDLQRAALGETMMQRIVRLLLSPRRCPAELRPAIARAARTAAEALANDETGRFATAAREIADAILACETCPPVSRHAALAICRYLDAGNLAVLPTEGVVFIVIALTSLGRSLAGQHPQDFARGRRR
ncbi:MAG: HEAT repeat domain-containing protein [Armatimonadetes bacterium]|nr:HEAT repeat domain-containing protein [Armatimonadota bacterium]